ncbi:MAG TPA: hypothetical protein VGI98_00620 [Candidatus Limnocylindrales bacterium]|jgi:glucose dehydrogenase
MRRSRIILALVLALLGIAWLAQGLNLIGGSVMSGSSFWAIVGAALLAVAIALVVVERRHAAA